MLWEACDIAFGQPFAFLIHLLSLVVGEHALHPKHDLDLHFQGQHVAKRFVLGIHQPSVVHDDNAKHESDLSAARPLINPYSSTDHPLAPGLFSLDEKSVPMGLPPRVSFRPRHPHVMPRHQSAPWVDSVKQAALLVLAHSALFSPAIQHGELFASAGAALRAPHGPI